MKNKTKHLNRYLFYDLLVMLIYGLILYFGFTWITQFSLVYGYLWNAALIILALAFDGYAVKVMQSGKIIAMLMKKYDTEKVCRIVAGGFITFKTLLFVFYIFILIASQIIDFNPALINENLANFILANNYSILVLLAFDTLMGQFSKDGERTKKVLEKIKKASAENQDRGNDD